MIPIIRIVGKGNIGKTTFMEKLIAELSSRGYRIGTVKHDVHGFEIDKEGKDTWRHAKAGARAVSISSSEKIAVIRNVDKELSLEQIAPLLGDDIDLIIAEGYKKSKGPKIEVTRTSISETLICNDNELTAVVTDSPKKSHIPHFDVNDPKELADFLETEFIRKAKKESLLMTVDGEEVPMNRFVQNIFEKVITAMTESLDGINPEGEIIIKINRRNKAK